MDLEWKTPIRGPETMYKIRLRVIVQRNRHHRIDRVVVACISPMARSQVKSTHRDCILQIQYTFCEYGHEHAGLIVCDDLIDRCRGDNRVF
jgi:hypothetical protein